MIDKHRTLWVVKKDMLANHDYKKVVGNREVVIKKGEIIEWRYESYNHFRTRDDKWFWVNDDVWQKHCVLIGRIIDRVAFENKANTEEIWRLKLFDWVTNGKECYINIKEELQK